MPTITDATVVAQAYDTSGNGGRKITNNSMNIFTAEKSTTQVFLQKYSSTTGNFAAFLTTNVLTSVQDVAIQATDKAVYTIFSNNNNRLTFYANDPNSGAYLSTANLDDAQTAIGNVSLAINEAKTELHAAWASKNATYPNSFNIRYAKGTINADGTVTWGAVEQVTNANSSGLDYTEPCLVLTTSKVIIFTNEANGTSTKRIRAFQKTSSWDILSISTTVYSGGTYAQSSPSAIFVPQSINGLANGRIWVAWHGMDATDTTVTNIRMSYSDDGGVTWSAMQKLTSGNTYYHQRATITANKNNEVFVVWDGTDATDVKTDIRQIKYSSGSWGSISVISQGTTGAKLYASTLFDLSLNFSSPLFIYRDLQNAKVGFYGIWTVTTISVTPGDIGQKADKNNILSYSITTDGEMSTITEKINGTIVNTRNTTSGQAVTLGLTQAQWDAIRFGKYADATGGKNTLTVEMGSEKWTYTFDKQLASDSDIISASKAVKDANEVYLPSVKKQLADAINAKGGSVSANADWLTMIGGITDSTNKRWASGTVPTNNSNTKTVSGLNFKPTTIYYKIGNIHYAYNLSLNTPSPTYPMISSNTSNIATVTTKNDGFDIVFGSYTSTITTNDLYWIAFE